VFSPCGSQWLRKIGFVLLRATGAIPQKVVFDHHLFCKTVGALLMGYEGAGRLFAGQCFLELNSVFTLLYLSACICLYL
jgi:hypothetical protein